MKSLAKFTQNAKNYLIITVFFYLIFSFYEWNFNPGEWDTLSRVAVIFLIAFVSIGESKK